MLLVRLSIVTGLGARTWTVEAKLLAVGGQLNGIVDAVETLSQMFIAGGPGGLCCSFTQMLPVLHKVS